MVSMSHGPRTLPRKPGSTPVTMKLVLDSDDLVETIHDNLWSCKHPENETLASQCEVLAERLMTAGIIQTAPDFLRSLKDNEAAQKVIIEAMAGAWHEGAHAQDGEENPYG